MTGTHDIALEVVAAYPRGMRPGQTSDLTIDVRHDADRWPYDAEEYVIYCMVEGVNGVDVAAVGPESLVLHRFGGTYGPARYRVSAGSDTTADAAVLVKVVNRAGGRLHTVTLEGIATVDEAPRVDYRRFRIAIVGTSAAELEQPASLAADALGRELARRGFGLVSTGRPGVDTVTTSAFVEAMAPDEAGRHALTLERLIRIPVTSGTLDEDLIAPLVAEADAVVVVGGRAWSRVARRAALRAGRAVIGFGGSGGLADELDPQTGSTPVESTEAAAAAASILVDRLGELTRRASVPPFTGYYVLVTGSAVGPSPTMRSAAAALGRELASRGLGLLTGGATGVDQLCTNAYVEQLGREPGHRIVHVTRSPRSAQDGTQMVIADQTIRRELRVTSAIAVVVIGGRDGTRHNVATALRHGRLTIPVPGTAGVADELARVLDFPEDAPLEHAVTILVRHLDGLLTSGRLPRPSLARSTAWDDLRAHLRSRSLLHVDRAIGSDDDGINLRELFDPISAKNYRFELGAAIASWALTTHDVVALALGLELLAGLEAWTEFDELCSRRAGEIVAAAVVALDYLEDSGIASALLERVRRAGEQIPDRRDPALARRVCRIVMRGENGQLGTGFLVGPDLLITTRQTVDPAFSGALSTMDLDFGEDRCTCVHVIAVSSEVDAALVRITPALGEVRGWFEISKDRAVMPGEVLTLIARGRRRLRVQNCVVLARSTYSISYRIPEVGDKGSELSSGCPLTDRNGRAVAIHAAAFAGSSTTHPAQSQGEGFRLGALFAEPRFEVHLARAQRPTSLLRDVEQLADDYDKIRVDRQSGPARTAAMDKLVAAAIERLGTHHVAPEDIRELFGRPRLGTRIAALVCCATPLPDAPYDVVASAIDRPQTAHEQWVALQVTMAAIGGGASWQLDGVMTALVQQVLDPASRINARAEGDRRGFAAEILREYRRHCGLPPDTRAEDLRDSWLPAAAPWQGLPRTVALLGSNSGGDLGPLCAALGAQLHARGWHVVAGGEESVGLVALRAVRDLRGLATYFRFGDPEDEPLEGIENVAAGPTASAEMVRRADCAIVVQGADGTARECGIARAHELPILALSFTGGTAEQLAPTLEVGLVARGIPITLLAPLRKPDRDPSQAARGVVRVLNMLRRAGMRKRLVDIEREGLDTFLLRVLTEDEAWSLSTQILGEPSPSTAATLVEQCEARNLLDALVEAALAMRAADDPAVKELKRALGLPAGRDRQR